MQDRFQVWNEVTGVKTVASQRTTLLNLLPLPFLSSFFPEKLFYSLAKLTIPIDKYNRHLLSVLLRVPLLKRARENFSLGKPGYALRLATRILLE